MVGVDSDDLALKFAEALHYATSHRTFTRCPANDSNTVGFEETQQVCF
jgi:hypothetical protein